MFVLTFLMSRLFLIIPHFGHVNIRNAFERFQMMRITVIHSVIAFSQCSLE